MQERYVYARRIIRCKRDRDTAVIAAAVERPVTARVPVTQAQAWISVRRIARWLCGWHHEPCRQGGCRVLMMCTVRAG